MEVCRARQTTIVGASNNIRRLYRVKDLILGLEENGYKYIAKDSNGEIYAFEVLPYREMVKGEWLFIGDDKHIYKPLKITDSLNAYINDTYKVFELKEVKEMVFKGGNNGTTS